MGGWWNYSESYIMCKKSDFVCLFVLSEPVTSSLTCQNKSSLACRTSTDSLTQVNRRSRFAAAEVGKSFYIFFFLEDPSLEKSSQRLSATFL